MTTTTALSVPAPALVLFHPAVDETRTRITVPIARVTLLVGDDPTVEFRSLVAPLCAAQALVMALGYAIAERNGRKPAVKKVRQRT